MESVIDHGAIVVGFLLKAVCSCSSMPIHCQKSKVWAKSSRTKRKSLYNFCFLVPKTTLWFALCLTSCCYTTTSINLTKIVIIVIVSNHHHYTLLIINLFELYLFSCYTTSCSATQQDLNKTK